MLQNLLWAAVSRTLVVTLGLAACIMISFSRSANKFTELKHDAGVDPTSRRTNLTYPDKQPFVDQTAAMRAEAGRQPEIADLIRKIEQA